MVYNIYSHNSEQLYHSRDSFDKVVHMKLFNASTILGLNAIQTDLHLFFVELLILFMRICRIFYVITFLLICIANNFRTKKTY